MPEGEKTLAFVLLAQQIRDGGWNAAIDAALAAFDENVDSGWAGAERLEDAIRKLKK